MPRRPSPSLFAVAAVAGLVAACAGGRPAEPPPPAAPAPSAPAPRSTAANRAPPAEANDDAQVAALSKAYLDFVVARSPESATSLGIHDRDGELDDMSLAAAAADDEKERALLERAREAGRLHLSRTARTDLALLEATFDVDLRTRSELHRLQRLATAYTGAMGTIYLMLARDYAPAADRARFALARIEKIPGTMAVAKSNLAAAPGIAPAPRVWTEIGIDVAGSASSFFDEQRAPLLAALPGEKARIDAALAGAKKAYADFKKYLEKDLLPRSTGSFAAGRPFFEFLLKRSYFLDQDADQVLASGQRILNETKAQMTEVARRIDPKAKGWPEVAARVKGNHPTAADLIPSYERELRRARDFLAQKDAVPFPAGDDCSVVETPVFLRSTITAAYDRPPPFDGITKGLFYVTPVDRSASKASQEKMLRENDHGDQVDTAVHEAYPGHHLQLSFARLHPSLVRKIGDAAVFSEGWGLYAEELMSELGYYTDEERLMQLEWTLVRAARVVIDVGLHTKGMTYDEALKILTDDVHLERPLALSEVKRYTTSPTQPLAYITGREAIFRIRERYKQREGDRFTLKAFHAEILSHGSIPPGLIAREMFAE